MSELPFYAMMAKPVAEQRSNTRESIRLVEGVNLVKILGRGVQNALRAYQRSIRLQTEVFTYCELHPAEC